MKKDVYQWRRAFHIPTLIVLQIVFVILFAQFVVYDPVSSIGRANANVDKVNDEAKDKIAIYPSKLLLKSTTVLQLFLSMFSAYVFIKIPK